jgi:hypothetical protein
MPASEQWLISQAMDERQDRANIDTLIARFFAAFDNRDDAVPRLDAIIDCFAPRAVIVCRSASVTAIDTPLEFAQPRIELLTRGALRDFHEYETSSDTSVFAGIAVRISRYGKRGRLDGSDYAGTGTKCFQLVELDGSWRIAALAWVDDAG